MNITATGTSSLSVLYLQRLLGLTDTSTDEDSETGASAGAADLLTLSAAGQQAAAAGGTDPFQTDLASLASSLASGDLDSARKAYRSMAEKMEKNGEIPSDFEAIGTALDSGDLAAAATALEGVRSKAAKGPQGGPPPQGAPAPEEDAATLEALLRSGDTGSARSVEAIAAAAYLANASALG